MDEIIRKSVDNVMGYMTKEDKEAIAADVKQSIVESGFNPDEVTEDALTSILKEQFESSLKAMIHKHFPFIKKVA